MPEQEIKIQLANFPPFRCHVLRLEGENPYKNPSQEYFISVLFRARNDINDPQFIEKDWEFLLLNTFTQKNKNEFCNAIRLFFR